jgi:Na+-driven multidrug efflux pump
VLLGVVLLLLRTAFVPLFTEDPAVRSLLADVLLVAAVAQPVCGVVFALDGVLIGAGDGRYLAWAGVATLLAFAPLALLVLAADGGLVALWWAFDAFLLARLLTLVPRWLGGRWMVTGATLPAR